MNLPVSRILGVPVSVQSYPWRYCLDDILDARLVAARKVHDFHRSSRQDSILQSSGAPPGSIVRTARLHDRILQIVAIPDCVDHPPHLGRKLRRHWGCANLLVVGELWLRRRPHLDVSQLIVASAGYSVSPLARLHLTEHLTDHGGSSPLIDCAAQLPEAQDPVKAVLAIAASKAVSIDISRPIGPLSRVSLSPIR